MNIDKALSTTIVELLQRHIKLLGFTPLVHFELEGCCRFPQRAERPKINFSVINSRFKSLNIEGTLVPEYWQHQWEYVSDFSGQSPLKEAQNLEQAITLLPQWFAEQGVEETLIKPVIWSGDQGKLARGSKNIFSHESRAVHIPNAVQINISALDRNGKNIICDDGFGEYLQQCFLETSLACCLLYMPEDDAFERLALKSKYGLEDELCSPIDISGGHQGSIALYKELGKHNQPMGLEPVLLDQFQGALVSEQNWQKTARIEHRLGASSVEYDPYLNVIYALANLVDALEVYLQGKCQRMLKPNQPVTKLPLQLKGSVDGKDALTLFKNSEWLNGRISQSQQFINQTVNMPVTSMLTTDLGRQLKRNVLAKFSHLKTINEPAL